MGLVVLEETIDARAFEILKESGVGTLASDMEIEMEAPSSADGPIEYLRIFSK